MSQKERMVLLVGSAVKGAIEKRVCAHCGHVQLRARSVPAKADLKCKKCGRALAGKPTATARSKKSR